MCFEELKDFTFPHTEQLSKQDELFSEWANGGCAPFLVLDIPTMLQYVFVIL